MAPKLQRGMYWAWLLFTTTWVLAWLGFFIFSPPPEPGWSLKLAVICAGVLILPPSFLFILGWFLLYFLSIFRRAQ